MSHDFLLGGIILSPLVPQLALSLLLTGLLSVVLMRLRFFQLVWQRPIVELAIFCMILGVLSAFVPNGWPTSYDSAHIGDLP